MPRGAEPLLRRAVGGCGVDTHIERLKRNSWGRHTCDRWVTFVLFPPAVADLTLWSPDGRHQAIHLTGGRMLTIPSGWSFSLVWHKTADAITLFSHPAFVRKYFPSETGEPVVTELTECLAACHVIADVFLDLQRFVLAPNGPADWQVACGGGYLAVLLFQARSMLTDGRFRHAGLGAEAVTRMRDYLRRHPKRRVPVREIAVNIGISPRQLRRIVREETGKSPVEWVRGEKARQIRELLAAGKSMKEAVAEGGFSNPSHLHRAMSRVFGGSARAFRGRRRTDG